ncbi:MAG: hypothetical protein M1814_006352 [Vezdaea aestivalis]|nr:MAG: hypothetical protein M1814_006352 [Vezdaea aestivalis]
MDYLAIARPREQIFHSPGQDAAYQRIIQVRDQVLNGTHPRISLRSSGEASISSLAVRTPAQPFTLDGSSVSHSQNAKLTNETPLLNSQFSQSGSFSALPQFASSQKPDPPLTQPNTAQQQRQETDRQLAGFASSRPAPKPAPSEKFTFGAAEIIDRALFNAKPAAENEGSEHGSGSVDQATYYSSQDNSRASGSAHSGPLGTNSKEVLQRALNTGALVEVDQAQANQRSEVQLQEETSKQQATSQPKTSATFIPGLTEIDRYQPEMPPLPDQQLPAPADDTDISRRSSWAFYEESHTEPQQPQQDVSFTQAFLPWLTPEQQHQNTSGRMWVEANYGSLQSSGPNDGRVVRNHISSPLAPQAARVSPLLMARPQPLENALNNRPADSPRAHPRPSRPEARRPRPTSPKTRGPAKKKHKVTNGNRKASNRGPAESPDPYIKAEPESPPPLSNIAVQVPKRRQAPPASIRSARRSPSPAPAYVRYEALSNRDLPTRYYQDMAPPQGSRLALPPPEHSAFVREEVQPYRYFSDSQIPARVPYHRQASPEGLREPRTISRYIDEQPREQGRTIRESQIVHRQYIPVTRPQSPPAIQELGSRVSPMARYPEMRPPSRSRVFDERLFDEHGREVITTQPRFYTRASPPPMTVRHSVAPAFRRETDMRPAIRQIPFNDSVVLQDNRIVELTPRRAMSTAPRMIEQSFETEGRPYVREYSARPIDMVRSREGARPYLNAVRRSPPSDSHVHQRAPSMRPVEASVRSPAFDFSVGDDLQQQHASHRPPVRVSDYDGTVRSSLVRADMPPPMTPTAVGPRTEEYSLRQRTVEPWPRYVSVPAGSSFVDSGRYAEPRGEARRIGQGEELPGQVRRYG